jgi:preprotein translocase subunit SecE
MREVRIEANKVTWPDRREVGVTTGMVIWMVIIAALYLFGVDFTVQHLVRGILNIFA